MVARTRLNVTLHVHCLPVMFIPITFIFSSNSSLRLSHGLPFFHLLEIISANVSQNAADFLTSLQADAAVTL